METQQEMARWREAGVLNERELRELEEMERGEMTLEMAMQKHAEGMELSQFCHQQLQAAEAAVNKVIRESDGILSENELILPEAD